jgi:hypothetical protein
LRMEKGRNELEWKERKQAGKGCTSGVKCFLTFLKKKDSVSFLKIKNKTIRY